MKHKNDEMKIKQPQPTSPEMPDPVQTTEVPGTPGMPETLEKPAPEPKSLPLETPEKAQPGPLKIFFRKALIWLLVIIIAFVGGFLLDHFLRYKPLSDDLHQAQSEMEDVKQDISDLQGQIEQIQPKLEAANARIATLEGDLEIANARLQFYQVLVDVNNARIALFLENIEEAQTALVDTKERLEELEPVIEEANPELAMSLPRRLELIVDGLERDPKTASIDLELFTKDLLMLEPLIFED
ncbi:MAG: hypothetical protein U9R53_09095 [Chloroflexota bacterium]|nr:hypothetical protein [Chloroflexota bacterium]